jgi:hypothetical protein
MKQGSFLVFYVHHFNGLRRAICSAQTTAYAKVQVKYLPTAKVFWKFRLDFRILLGGWFSENLENDFLQDW